MTAVGFEPTSTNTDDLKSSPLDRSGTLSYIIYFVFFKFINTNENKVGHVACYKCGKAGG